MALNFVGSVLTGSAAAEASASGYTPPAVTPVADTDIVYQVSIQIDKATVDESAETSTWGAIYTELDVAGVAFTGYFDAANTVDTYFECSAIELVNTPKYGDTAPYYLCNCKLRGKVTV